MQIDIFCTVIGKTDLGVGETVCREVTARLTEGCFHVQFIPSLVPQTK